MTVRPTLSTITRRLLPPALAALTASCDQSPDAPAASPAPAIFVDATEDVGLAFHVERHRGGDYYMPDSMAAGCALFDCDGDGDLDLYVVNGCRGDAGGLESDAGVNRLYRMEPDGRFADVTAGSAAGDRGYGMGVAAGDYDNDGDVDLYLANDGPDRLLRNDGDGTFTDVTGAAGMRNDAWSASAGFFDYDGDGFLDLFVTNYLDYDPSVRGRDASGRPEYASPSMFDGVADVLYRNRGDGTFADESARAGIARAVGKGLGLIFTDLDGDDRVDVYVANDGEPNFAWINRGDGAFVEDARRMGIATNANGLPEASMGVACGDVDGDGDQDLLMTHLVLQTNTLYRQVTPGAYSDDTMSSGIGGASVDRTGFGASFLDVDLDGDLDLASVNGRVLRRPPVYDAPGLTDHWRPYAEPNQLMLGDGAGRFSDAGAACGAFCDDVEVGRGLAVGDLDDDGDLDLVVTNGNGTVRVYRNEAARRGHWLLLRVVDPALNRDAIGAVVRVTAGGRTIRRDVRTTHSYLCSSDPRVHVGLGAARSYDEIAVGWPDGTVEVFGRGGGGEADRALTLFKGAGERAAGEASQRGGGPG